MADRLKGKRALVTAAGQGIGRAIAEAFLAEGAEVVATDLDAAKLADLAGAATSALDVRDGAAVEALVAAHGPFDVLANAAGVVHAGSILDCSDADWDLAFDVNVRSMHRTIRAVLPGMLERGRGSIVNVASVAGVAKAVPNRYVYNASKAAVVGLTKGIAADFVRSGVRANAICPGTVQSPSLEQRMTEQAAASGKPLAEVRQAFVDRQPMGRLGEGREVAALAVYLASDESSFVTGHLHFVDGGFAI